MSLLDSLVPMYLIVISYGSFFFCQPQAITALKRGSYLLKYGRKPKFCPFWLSNVSPNCTNITSEM